MIFVFSSIGKIIIPFSYRAPLTHLTSCIPTKSNLNLPNSLAAAVKEPALYRLLTLQSTKSHVPFPLLMSYRSISQGPRLFLQVIRNTILYYGEELLAPCPTLKLRDHFLSAVRDCLFNILAATLHIGGRSSIINLKTRHAIVTGNQLSREL